MDKKMPFCGIIKTILEKSKSGMNIEELTQSALQSWGRNFPQTNYQPAALVFKLAVTYLPVDILYSGEPITVTKINGQKSLLSEKLVYQELNQIVNELKQVKLKLKK